MAANGPTLAGAFSPNRKVTVTIGGKRSDVSVDEAITMQLRDEALRGNKKSRYEYLAKCVMQGLDVNMIKAEEPLAPGPPKAIMFCGYDDLFWPLVNLDICSGFFYPE